MSFLWSHLCKLLYFCHLSWKVVIFRMATAVFQQSIGTHQSHGHLYNSGIQQELGKSSVRLISKAIDVNVGLSKRAFYNSGKRNRGVIRASSSQSSVIDHVSSPSKNKESDSRKKSSKLFFLALI